MKFNKKGRALYIDADEKYHFIVSEMLKSKIDINFAINLDSAVEVINKTKDHLDTIIFCVDNIDFSQIINTIFFELNCTINLILVSSNYDSIQMYDFISIFGAADYLTKPFSKQGILECYSLVQSTGERAFKKRLIHDLKTFNDQIKHVNQEFSIDPPIEHLKLMSLDQMIQRLMDIKQRLESYRPFPKSSRPNILFIDDEKNIIDVYQNFVEDKPFNSFFSQNLAESQTVLASNDIDIIILDLGLPDGHGVNLLKEIYQNDCCDPKLPDVIVISSYYEKDTVVDVINAGAKVFINKPMTYKKFISVIYQLTFLRFMRKELNKLNYIKKIEELTEK